MSKRKPRGFEFERLEDRRLLAADCCAQVFQCCDMLPAETCMAITMEVEDGMVESELEEPVVVDAEPVVEVENEGLPAELNEDAVTGATEDSVTDDAVEDATTTVVDESDPDCDIEVENEGLPAELNEDAVTGATEDSVADDAVEDATTTVVDESDPDCDIEVENEGLPAELNEDAVTGATEDSVTDDAVEDATTTVVDESDPDCDIEVENEGLPAELNEDAVTGATEDSVTDDAVEDATMTVVDESDPDCDIEVGIESPVAEATQSSVVDEANLEETAPVAIESEASEQLDAALGTDESGSELEVAEGTQVAEQELLAAVLHDPVTGTAGYFGEIDQINPAKSMTFTPSESGTVDIVIASSFGESETRLDVTDGEGELVTSSTTEDLNGFQQLTIDVIANQTYQLTVSSDELGEGYFMVTIEFDALVESLPVDAHANEIGTAATLLEVEQGQVAIESSLETAEDCDAFRFVAPADGEMLLGMAASSEDHQSDAIVTVFDGEGQFVVAGSTNEEVAIRFDAQSGVEYQVLVDSQNDVPTQYSLNGTWFANVAEETETVDDAILPADPALVDEASTEIEDGLAICDSDWEATENELLDEIFEQLGDDPMADTDSLRAELLAERSMFRRT